jgi:hypothetical protein
MGANTPKDLVNNTIKMRDTQRQQENERRMQFRRDLLKPTQQQYTPTEGQITPFKTSAPPAGFNLETAPQPLMGSGPEMRSGIDFGPGRANRIPEQGSSEYEQLLQRVRNLEQLRR